MHYQQGAQDEANKNAMVRGPKSGTKEKSDEQLLSI